jgi:C-terminal processing protease CtpA/Prc
MSGRRDDRLLAVDGREVEGMGLHDVHHLIEGQEGSRVYLTVVREQESRQHQGVEAVAHILDGVTHLLRDPGTPCQVSGTCIHA